MLLDHTVPQTTPLQPHFIPVSCEEVPDRSDLLANQHSTLCYSLASTENPEYFSYMSAGLKVLHYANKGCKDKLLEEIQQNRRTQQKSSKQ